MTKPINFISKLFKKDLSELYGSSAPTARLQNIAWPSESSVQLGRIAVGECRRSLFYKILGVTPTEPMSVVGKSICDAGNLYEINLINKFKANDLLISEQVPMNFIIPNSRHSVQVRGRMDCIVQFDDNKSVVEIKSVGEFKAAKIMSGSDLPLPAPSNLMQAMLYKYYTTDIEEGKKLGIKDVYLMYVNRSTGETFYYKIEIEDGFPVITAFNQAGNEVCTIKLKDVKSFAELELTPGVSTSDDARLAELRININDMFTKMDEVYDSVTTKTLPHCDYSLVYDEEQAKREHAIGRLSKMKLNKVLKGEVMGDNKCLYCAYRTKCMADSGIRLK